MNGKPCKSCGAEHEVEGTCVHPAALSTPIAHDVREWRPEDGDTRCQQCGQPNPIWWADNAQWNATVGGPDATDDPGGVLCPTCYHAKWLGREVAPTTPPADDVREALAADLRHVIGELPLAETYARRLSGMGWARPHGTVTDAEVSRVQHDLGQRFHGLSYRERLIVRAALEAAWGSKSE